MFTPALPAVASMVERLDLIRRDHYRGISSMVNASMMPPAPMKRVSWGSWIRHPRRAEPTCGKILGFAQNAWTRCRAGPPCGPRGRQEGGYTASVPAYYRGISSMVNASMMPPAPMKRVSWGPWIRHPRRAEPACGKILGFAQNAWARCRAGPLCGPRGRQEGGYAASGPA